MENLLNWTRDSQNKLMFIERIEKYALFKNPQVRPLHLTPDVCKTSGLISLPHICRTYLSGPDVFQNYLLGKKETSEMADRNKEALLEVSLTHVPKSTHTLVLLC